MPIPIQINYNRINKNSRVACNGYSGSLPSWEFGLSPEFKERMTRQFNDVGKLAQFETVNSPYYTQVQIDPNYIRFLQEITNCNK